MTDDQGDGAQQPGATIDPRDVVDAGTVAGVSAQRKRVKHDADRAGDFWRAVLADPVGRHEIHNLLDEVGAFKKPFQQSSAGFPDPESTWFKAGQQAMGLSLFMRLMRHDFAGVNTMLLEHEPFFQAGTPK